MDRPFRFLPRLATVLLGAVGLVHAATPAPASPDTRSAVDALTRATSAVVGVEVQAIAGARSIDTLGPRRRGSGVVIGADGTVLTERSDIFILNDGRRTECRVMGAFTVNDDNLIVHWRDYFDLADWNRQLGADPDFGRKGYRQMEAATTAGE